MPRKIAWIAFWMTMMYWLGGFWGCAAPGDDQNYKMLDEDESMFETEPPGLQSREEIAEDLGIALAEPPVSPEKSAEAETADTVDEESEVVAVTDEIDPSETERPAATPLAEGPEPATDAYVDASVVETEPSVSGLDRSHWGTMAVRPTDGRTAHNPVYFSDVDLRAKLTPVESEVYLESESTDRGTPEAEVEEPAQDVSAGENGEEGEVAPPQVTVVPLAVAYDEPALVDALEGAKAGGVADSTNLADLVVQPMKFAVDLIFLPIKALLNPPLAPITTPPGDHGE